MLLLKNKSPRRFYAVERKDSMLNDDTMHACRWYLTCKDAKHPPVWMMHRIGTKQRMELMAAERAKRMQYYDYYPSRDGGRRS
jgi:hypothetical protein